MKRNEGFWLWTHIPKGFKSFSSSGIVLWNKSEITSSTSYSGAISIEVMNPKTGSYFTTGARPKGIRIQNTSDSKYEPIQIPGTGLNAYNFVEGQLLKILVHTRAIDTDINYTWRKFGKLEFHFDGD